MYIASVFACVWRCSVEGGDHGGYPRPEKKKTGIYVTAGASGEVIREAGLELLISASDSRKSVVF